MPLRKKWVWERPGRYYSRTRSYIGDRRRTAIVVILLLIVLLLFWNQSARKGHVPKTRTISVDFR